MRRHAKKRKSQLLKKITMVLVWIMIIATLGSLVAGAVSSLGMFN
nr:DUF4044 domain-containing protein [Secundilactobacillus odoratitofui]